MHAKHLDEADGLRDVAATAAQWVDRLTAGEPSAHDIANLNAWLAEDPEHERQYERIRAIWLALSDTRLAKHRRAPLRLVGSTAMAACLALLFLAGPGYRDQVTAAGEVRQIKLQDGTIAWLDSDSAIDLQFTDERRLIRLYRGRIALDVAHGDPRHLAVEAGGATITDVGTMFSVDRNSDLAVAVAEGAVHIASDDSSISLQKGEAASFDGASAVKRAVRTGEFAWRAGRIVFDRIPLDRALGELDRYYDGRIILTNSNIARRRVSGTLFADRAEDGVDTLARNQKLQIIRLPWLILVR